MTVRQLYLLLILHSLGQDTEFTLLCARSGYGKSIASRCLSSLGSLGFIARKRLQDDQRRVLASLTDKGPNSWIASMLAPDGQGSGNDHHSAGCAQEPSPSFEGRGAARHRLRNYWPKGLYQ
jgi:hypothetical protein